MTQIDSLNRIHS